MGNTNTSKPMEKSYSNSTGLPTYIESIYGIKQTPKLPQDFETSKQIFRLMIATRPITDVVKYAKDNDIDIKKEYLPDSLFNESYKVDDLISLYSLMSDKSYILQKMIDRFTEIYEKSDKIHNDFLKQMISDNVNWTDDFGNNILHLLCHPKQCFELIDYIIHNCSGLLCKTNKYNATPLIYIINKIITAQHSQEHYDQCNALFSKLNQKTYLQLLKTKTKNTNDYSSSVYYIRPDRTIVSILNDAIDQEHIKKISQIIIDIVMNNSLIIPQSDNETFIQIIQLLLITKTIPEIENIMKNNKIILKSEYIPLFFVEKIIDNQNINDLMILYSLTNNKSIFIVEKLFEQNDMITNITEQKHIDFIKQIIRDNINWIDKSHFGENINMLHLACKYHSHRMIDYIMEINNNLITKPNKTGMTPFDYIIIYLDKSNFQKDLEFMLKINKTIYVKLMKNKTSDGCHIYSYKYVIYLKNMTFLDIINEMIEWTNTPLYKSHQIKHQKIHDHYKQMNKIISSVLMS